MATICGARLVGDFSSFCGCQSVLFRFLFSRCIFASVLGLYHLLVALFEHRVYVHGCDITCVRPRDVQRSVVAEMTTKILERHDRRSLKQTKYYR